MPRKPLSDVFIGSTAKITCTSHNSSCKMFQPPICASHSHGQTLSDWSDFPFCRGVDRCFSKVLPNARLTGSDHYWVFSFVWVVFGRWFE